jgi:xanthine dehydrogenase accessory factor
MSELGEGYVWVVSLSENPTHAVADLGASDPVSQAAKSALQQSKNAIVESGGRAVFLQVRPIEERLVIVGGVHIAVHLTSFANELGFRTIVVDPRETFSSADRFERPPDQIIKEWPSDALSKLGLNDSTYVAVLTHDSKIDDDALRVAIRSDAKYIGVLGGKSTHEKRKLRLMSEGFSQEEVNRIHGPIGLDIGSVTPEEIALSVIAQIVQVKRRG